MNRVPSQNPGPRKPVYPHGPWTTHIGVATPTPLRDGSERNIGDFE